MFFLFFQSLDDEKKYDDRYRSKILDLFLTLFVLDRKKMKFIKIRAMNSFRQSLSKKLFTNMIIENIVVDSLCVMGDFHFQFVIPSCLVYIFVQYVFSSQSRKIVKMSELTRLKIAMKKSSTKKNIRVTA